MRSVIEVMKPPPAVVRFHFEDLRRSVSDRRSEGLTVPICNDPAQIWRVVVVAAVVPARPGPALESVAAREAGDRRRAEAVDATATLTASFAAG